MNAPCSTELLQSALAGDLPADDETALQRHLESCEQCSAALEHLAGGAAWRQEVAALLTRDELDAAATNACACDEWSTIDFTVDHLEPADDPNVLGRLGGYDVLEIIGRGGMGVVLKGFDRELKRCVAIKVLAPHLAQSALAKKRFAREAQAAAAVVHPHVLAIHQVQAGGRLPFLVMPLVAGESLAERLAAQGRLELKETLRIGMQAAAGLAAAHEQGLVHRDVKPANILLERGVERAVLTDFGLARAADDATLTRWGVIAGTPQYMSPEQARGEPLDGRSDLFSLGCVLYEMATGVSPFRADSMMATMRRLVDDAPQSMVGLNAELPPWFVGIVERLLAKEPGRRFGSAREVSEVLEQCLAHVQQPAVVALPEGLRTRASGGRRLPPAMKWVAAGAFGFLLVACGVLIVLDWKKGTLTIASEDNVVAGQKRARGPADADAAAGTHSRKKASADEGDHLFAPTKEAREKGSDLFAPQEESTDEGGELFAPKKESTGEGGELFAPKKRASEDETDAFPLKKGASDGAEDLFAPKEEPAEEGVSLSNSVRQFNERLRQTESGRSQPLVTDDEVVAAVRWYMKHEPIVREFTPRQVQQLRDVTERRVLAPGWHFDLGTTDEGAEGEHFQVWRLYLTMEGPFPSAPALSYGFRKQFIAQVDVGGKPLALAQPANDLKNADDGARPLASAINGFNERWHALGGVEMSPLTEREVIAAIRCQKAQRDELDISNRDFAELQQIGETRMLPAGAEIEAITGFRPGDGYDYQIWSVRLSLPRAVDPVPYPRFEIMLRNQFVRCDALDGGKIAWGPVGKNGYQVGVRLEPHHEQYVVGQQVTPHFHFRTGVAVKEISFPRLMTRGYYHEITAVNASGAPLEIVQEDSPPTPVGWVQVPFGFGAEHEIPGLPIVLGDVGRGDAETVIRAAAGQSVRLRFTYSAQVQTGDVEFTMAGEAPTRKKPGRSADEWEGWPLKGADKYR